MSGRNDRKGGKKQSKDVKRNTSKGKGRASVLGGNSKEGSVASKLHHSVQVAGRAAKKARTFEIQKVVRKIKNDTAKVAADAPAASTSTSAGEAQKELEALLEALKNVDVESLASYALRAKLSKDKSGVRDNQDIQAFFDKVPDQSIDPTTVQGKAQNRILASKVTVDCLNEVLKGLKARAGLEVPNGKATQTGRSANVKTKRSELPSTPEVRAPSTSQAAIDKLLASKAKRELQDQNQNENRNEDITSDESELEDSDDVDDDDATVSHISADEDDALAVAGEFQGIARDSDDEDDDDNEDVSVASTSSFPLVKSPARSPMEAPNKPKVSTKRKATSPPTGSKPTTTSAFLPSLAATYTLGDSDGSVYSHSDEEGGVAKPQRKNRRGQRARQAIWERKFGKNAKHVKMRQTREEETEENRRRTRAEKEIEALKKSGRYVYGVDANLTGVQEGKQKREWAKETDLGAGPGVAQTARLLEPEKARKQQEEKAMHPSWEAKKKAKAAQTSIIGTAPVAAKKIRFD